jgi:uncharacterized protein (DUF58 family)
MSGTAPDLRPDLRLQAQGLGHALPALLAQASQLAAALAFGAHGRRRAGAGDEFWQYRPAQAGDSAGAIDWRRSARGDVPFVREREWQALNSIGIWADGAQSMRFASDGALPQKADRAAVLALALALMLLRGGERVGLIGGAPAKAGRTHLGTLAAEMMAQKNPQDYGQAEMAGGTAAHLLYFSDFLGPLPALQTAMMQAADRGARGALVHILDPIEESFPFTGRVVFQSVGGSLTHQTQSAEGLRARYIERLAQRKDELTQLSRSLGWDYHLHHTDAPATRALIWAHGTISGAAR